MLTDLHCHMLPGIDDGSRNVAQSIEMARIAVADVIATTILTPHHLNGVYVNRAEQIRNAAGELQARLREAGVELDLLPGSELHLVPELPDELADGRALTLGDRGRAALVELPVHTVPMGAETVLEQIIAQGLVPVIAHPERNSQLRRTPERLADWVEMGCLGQVTAQSCTGRFGQAVQRAAQTMIRAGSIHVVASDAHRDRRRVPQITPAREPIQRWTNERVATLLIETFPGELAAGRMPERLFLERALQVQKPRGLFARLFG